MSTPAKSQEDYRPSARSEARATSMLLVAGAGLVALSLILPHPSGGHTVDLIATAAGMLVAGALLWVGAARVPAAFVHGVIAATVLATGVLILESEVAVGQFGSIFVWATLITAYFSPAGWRSPTSSGCSRSTPGRWRWCRAPPDTRRSPASSSPP